MSSPDNIQKGLTLFNKLPDRRMVSLSLQDDTFSYSDRLRERTSSMYSVMDHKYASIIKSAEDLIISCSQPQHFTEGHTSSIVPSS